MKKGFTLIELLVVIAIVGILSQVILASMQTARQKARDAKRVAELQQLQLALELYYDDNKSYPADIYAVAPNGLSPKYVPSMPYDPAKDVNGLDREYGYERGNPAVGKYCLGIILEIGTPDTSVCTLPILCTV